MRAQSCRGSLGVLPRACDGFSLTYTHTVNMSPGPGGLLPPTWAYLPHSAGPAALRSTGIWGSYF